MINFKETFGFIIQNLHVLFHILRFPLRKLVAYQSLRFPCNLLLKVINGNYTLSQKTLQKYFFLSLVNDELRYCIGLDITKKIDTSFSFCKLKVMNLCLQQNWFLLYKFFIIHSTPISLSQQRDVIQFEKEFRLESTAAWDSKLGSFFLSHTAIKLNYVINYSLVY